MPPIYVSYARRDGSDLAKKIVEALRSQGHDVAWDVDSFSKTDPYYQAVRESLHNATHIIAILTPAALHDDLVAYGWLHALNMPHKTIIPVLYRPCEVPPPLQPHLIDCHTPDLFDPCLQKIAHMLTVPFIHDGYAVHDRPQIPSAKHAQIEQIIQQNDPSKVLDLIEIVIEEGHQEDVTVYFAARAAILKLLLVPKYLVDEAACYLVSLLILEIFLFAAALQREVAHNTMLRLVKMFFYRHRNQQLMESVAAEILGDKDDPQHPRRSRLGLVLNYHDNPRLQKALEEWCTFFLPASQKHDDPHLWQVTYDYMVPKTDELLDLLTADQPALRAMFNKAEQGGYQGALAAREKVLDDLLDRAIAFHKKERGAR